MGGSSSPAKQRHGCSVYCLTRLIWEKSYRMCTLTSERAPPKYGLKRRTSYHTLNTGWHREAPATAEKDIWGLLHTHAVQDYSVIILWRHCTTFERTEPTGFAQSALHRTPKVWFALLLFILATENGDVGHHKRISLYWQATWPEQCELGSKWRMTKKIFIFFFLSFPACPHPMGQ